MFSKYYALKTRVKNKMSDSLECLLDNEMTNPEQKLNEQMLRLSLASKQPQLKQDTDDKISIKDEQTSKNIANNYWTQMDPDYFQHNLSYNNYQRSRYLHRGIRQKFINQSKRIQEMFSWARGSQMISNDNLNHNYSFEPYQQDLSMQFHPTEPESFKSSKDRSYKKSRRDFVRIHHRFFKGRHARDRSHDTALLLP